MNSHFMLAGMRPELLNKHLISLSNDTLAVVDVAEKGKGNTDLASPTSLTSHKVAYGADQDIV